MNIFKFLKAVEPLTEQELTKLNYSNVESNQYQTILEILDLDFYLKATVVIPRIKSYYFVISHFEDSFRGDTIKIGFDDFHNMDINQLILTFGKKDIKCLDIIYDQLKDYQ